MSSSTPQTSDASPHYPNINDDTIHESAFAKRRCCFCCPIFLSNQPSGSVFWQRINPLETTTTPNATTAAANVSSDSWWGRQWNRVREWSEIVAGPKWKTLIRKISKKRRQHGHGKFHYDPLSYALNFDEGPGKNGHYDEDLIGRGFSSRYSLPPSCKTSLDFDKEGIVL